MNGMIIIKTIKRILPRKVVNYLKIKHFKYTCLKEYKYDFERYFIFSDTNGSDTSIKLIGKIIREYHVIEKGLTMPNSRMGFGKEIILSLCNNCKEYLSKYDYENEQLKHAIGVISEYHDFHLLNDYQLDNEVLILIQELLFLGKCDVPTSQKEITREKYFGHIFSSFSNFSNSRSSVRNFCDEDITEEKLIEVLDLVRNTPSACNRQSWRTYVFCNKKIICEILETQGGNRGFGHLANKLIVITGELGGFSGIAERNSVYIDGGMYAMNLLYSLHFNKIAACILNCSHSIQKDKKLRELISIKQSEVFIAMIACGIPPKKFKIASSKRYELDKTNIIK